MGARKVPGGGRHQTGEHGFYAQALGGPEHWGQRKGGFSVIMREELS